MSEADEKFLREQLAEALADRDRSRAEVKRLERELDLVLNPDNEPAWKSSQAPAEEPSNSGDHELPFWLRVGFEGDDCEPQRAHFVTAVAGMRVKTLCGGTKEVWFHVDASGLALQQVDCLECLARVGKSSSLAKEVRIGVRRGDSGLPRCSVVNAKDKEGRCGAEIVGSYMGQRSEIDCPECLGLANESIGKCPRCFRDLYSGEEAHPSECSGLARANAGLSNPALDPWLGLAKESVRAHLRDSPTCHTVSVGARPSCQCGWQAVLPGDST